VLGCLLVLLAGCSDLGESGGKGYLGGSGQVRILDQNQRPDPVSAPGVDLEGKPINFGEHQGQVVVINVWETECVECRVEAPLLKRVSEDLTDVVFLGINIRDPDQSIGRGFVEEFDLSYPSYFDPDGKTLLSFSGELTVRAIPTTLVLDSEGRPAAAIYGEIPSERTLRGVIDEVRANG
jgi:thiol-disulfide isomerase/thioredoxin